jgi:hypothetical protein
MTETLKRPVEEETADFVADLLRDCLRGDAQRTRLPEEFLADRLALLEHLRHLAKAGEELVVIRGKFKRIREVLDGTGS